MGIALDTDPVKYRPVVSGYQEEEPSPSTPGGWHTPALTSLSLSLTEADAKRSTIIPPG